MLLPSGTSISFPEHQPQIRFTSLRTRWISFVPFALQSNAISVIIIIISLAGALKPIMQGVGEASPCSSQAQTDVETAVEQPHRGGDRSPNQHLVWRTILIIKLTNTSLCAPGQGQWPKVHPGTMQSPSCPPAAALPAEPTQLCAAGQL